MLGLMMMVIGICWLSAYFGLFSFDLSLGGVQTQLATYFNSNTVTPNMTVTMLPSSTHIQPTSTQTEPILASPTDPPAPTNTPYPSWTPDPTITPTFTATSTPTEITPLDPDEFIITYYTLINNRQYDYAWDMLSKNFKQTHNPSGFDEYAAWWATVDEVEILDIEIFEWKENRANLA